MDCCVGLGLGRMVKYCRFISLSRQFAALRPVSPPVSWSISISNTDKEEDVGPQKFQPSPRLHNTYLLMETTYRMRYALKMQDWVCLLELFEDLDRLAETHKILCGDISRFYIKTLVMMLDSKLLTEEEFADDEKQNSTNNKKRNRSVRNAQALCVIKEKLIKYSTQYNDLITSFRETQPEKGKDLEEFHLEDDDEIEIEFEPFPYCDFRVEREEVGPWVKGQDEIEWERIQQLFYDVPVLRGGQKMEQIKEMEFVVKSAVTPSQKLRFIIDVIRAQIAINHTLFTPMSSNLWKDCVFNMFVALDILTRYPNISVTPHFNDEGPWKYETKKTTGYKGKIRVWGDFLIFLVRIYFEFDMSLKFICPDTGYYWDRLKDEAHLFLLFNNFMDYFLWKKDFSRSVHVAFLLLELVYYKSQAEYGLLLKHVNLIDFGESGDKNKDVQACMCPRQPNFPEDCREFVDILVSVIYDHGHKNTQLQAMIYDLYHYALIGDFSTATYLLSTTHLDSKVQDMARSTYLHYNRALAQLGVCAFKAGAIQSAYSTLSDLYHTGSIEEMLAQDVPQTHTREPKMFEPLGKMPYHMRIDLELLKAVHLICAMLLGDLERAVNTHDNKGTFSSKSETSVLDQVMAANEALKEGNFAKSFHIVESLDCLRLLWNGDGVSKMLYTMMKEEALKHYLVTISKYPSVHLEVLARWFELSEADTKRIVDGMMEELDASWDEPTRCLIFCNVRTDS